MSPSPRTIPPALLAALQAHLSKADARHGPMPMRPLFILAACAEELGGVAAAILDGKGRARACEGLLDLAAAAIRGVEALSHGATMGQRTVNKNEKF